MYRNALIALCALALVGCTRSDDVATESPSATVEATVEPSPTASAAAPATPAPGAPTRAPGAPTPAPTRATGAIAPKTVELAQADNGRTVEVRVGDTLTVTLDENPSTGRGWTYEQPPDEKVVKRVSDEYKPDPTPPGQPRTGSGGKHVFMLQAAGTGSTAVNLALRPPGGGTPEQRWSVTVRVT